MTLHVSEAPLLVNDVYIRVNNKKKVAFVVTLILLSLTIVFATYALNSINATKERLADTETLLSIKTTELSQTKANLDKASDQLYKTATQLALANAQIDAKKEEIATIGTQLQASNDKQSQLVSSYSSLRDTINARSGYFTDHKKDFITPSDPAVSALAQKLTTGYTGDTNKLWSDYQSLHSWVVKNIKYSSDSYLPLLSSSVSSTFIWGNDFWRMPSETISDKAGDCEDMALLLASTMKSYNNNNLAVWLIRISTTTPEPKGHLAVAFPVQGGKLAILDPAGDYYTGMERGSLRSDKSTTAINNWLAHWELEMPGAKVEEVFSEDFDLQFPNTADFITWLGQRIY